MFFVIISRWEVAVTAGTGVLCVKFGECDKLLYGKIVENTN